MTDLPTLTGNGTKRHRSPSAPKPTATVYLEPASDKAPWFVTVDGAVIGIDDPEFVKAIRAMITAGKKSGYELRPAQIEYPS